MHEKGVLRALIRQARSSKAGAAIDPALVTQLPGWQRVAAYRALPGEPDPTPLLESLPQLAVFLPRIEGTNLGWVELSGETQFEIGPFGIEQPIGPDVTEQVAAVDAILIPALAVDIHGRRLGQGAGYYDRFLATLPRADGPLRVAVVHDDEVLQEIPDEPHDMRVDALLTPTRFLPIT